jgi:GTPase
LVASKIDAANADKLTKLKRYSKKHKLELYSISAVTGEGVEELKGAMARKVEEMRRSEAAASQSENPGQPTREDAFLE